MSARDELIKLMVDELAQRARLDEVPDHAAKSLLIAITDQTTATLPAIQAWLADDSLISAVVDELKTATSLDDEQVLSTTYRVLSRIDKEVSGD